MALFWHLARHNLNQCKLSQADSCQGRNVSFNQRWKNTNGKVTEHEVPGVTLPNIRKVYPPALDFSGWRSIHLVKNCRREIFSEMDYMDLKKIARINTDYIDLKMCDRFAASKQKIIALKQ